jgi:hypothetical protein
MSALDRGQLSASHPGSLPPDKTTRYPLNRRLSGPRVGLDVVEKTKNNFDVWHPFVLPVLINSAYTVKHNLLLIN